MINPNEIFIRALLVKCSDFENKVLYNPICNQTNMLWSINSLLTSLCISLSPLSLCLCLFLYIYIYIYVPENKTARNRNRDV